MPSVLGPSRKIQLCGTPPPPNKYTGQRLGMYKVFINFSTETCSRETNLLLQNVLVLGYGETALAVYLPRLPPEHYILAPGLNQSAIELTYHSQPRRVEAAGWH